MSHLLSYELPARSTAAAWCRKVIGWGCVLIIAVLVGCCSVPFLLDRYRLLSIQRACSEYVLPANTVTYDDDAVRSKPFLAASGYESSHWAVDLPHGRFMLDSVFLTQPNWGAYFDRCVAIEHRAALLWLPPGVNPAPTLFMHELQTPTGDRRIVCVRRVNTLRSIGDPLALETAVLTPATFLQPPLLLSHEGVEGRDGLPVELPVRSLRYYAGQPDPANAASFTIVYQQGDVLHTIRGYLTPDGRSVTLVQTR